MARRDREVAMRLLELAPPLRVALEQPADAQARQAEGLREVAEHRRSRVLAGRARRRAVIDRVIHLVDDELNSAPLRERVERPHGALVDQRAARVVRRVDEDQLRARVREAHDLVDVEREAALEVAARSAASRDRAPREAPRTARTTASAR